MSLDQQMQCCWVSFTKRLSYSRSLCILCFDLSSGANTLLHYEQVLSAIVYANSRPEELNSRTFRLSCTEMNGRFVSNQLSVTVSPNAALLHITRSAVIMQLSNAEIKDLCSYRLSYISMGKMPLYLLPVVSVINGWNCKRYLKTETNGGGGELKLQ